jgi:hypothetical protein
MNCATYDRPCQSSAVASRNGVALCSACLDNYRGVGEMPVYFADVPAPYKLIDGVIGEWKGGMYRFYCYPSSWHISPAARAGHTVSEGARR